MIKLFKRIREFFRGLKMSFAVKNSCKCMACGKPATIFIKNYLWSARACSDHAALAEILTEGYADLQIKRDEEAIASLRS